VPERVLTPPHPRSSLVVVTGRAAHCNPTRHGQVEKGEEEDCASSFARACVSAVVDTRVQPEVIRPWCWYRLPKPKHSTAQHCINVSENQILSVARQTVQSAIKCTVLSFPLPSNAMHLGAFR
jgi:hypothetical protein